MPAREVRGLMQVLTGGSGVQALSGLAAIVLSVLGLVGIARLYMVAIAAIIIGVSLLVHGMAAAAADSAGLGGEAAGSAEIGGGVSVAVLCGITTIILGILSILNIAPEVLMPISAIVIGAGLSLSAGLQSRTARTAAAATLGIGDTLRMALGAGAGSQVLIGIAVVVLGVLAVVGVAPAVLTLVAFLATAVSLLLSGFTVGGMAAAALRQ